MMCSERRRSATSFPIPRWRGSGTRGLPSSAQQTRNVASVNGKTNLQREKCDARCDEPSNLEGLETTPRRTRLRLNRRV